MKFASPNTNAKLLKVVSHKADKFNPPLEYVRVRISVENFVRLAHPGAAIDEDAYVIISLPKVILAVAARDVSAAVVDVSLSPIYFLNSQLTALF
jgi:hypothetical protein